MEKEKIIEVLEYLQKDIHDRAVKKGFWPTYEEANIGEKIALIHSEFSEALEAVRKGFPPDHHCPEFDNFTVELADGIIRTLDLAGGLDLPLAEAMIAKMEANAKRPPKHDKKF